MHRTIRQRNRWRMSEKVSTESYIPYSDIWLPVPSVQQRGQLRDQRHGYSPWRLCHLQCYNHYHRHWDKVGGQRPPVLHKASDCLVGLVDLRQYVQTCGRQPDWSIAAKQHSRSVNNKKLSIKILRVKSTLLLLTSGF